MNKSTKKKAAPKKKAAVKKATAAKKTKTVKKTAKKSVAKKTAGKKTAVKKDAVKKTAVKKSTTKKSSPKKTTKAPVEEHKPVITVKGYPKKTLDHFREKLLREKQRVLEEMGGIQAGNLKQSISDQSGENSRYSYHLGDVASLSYGREFTMGLAERQQKYLEQVDDALQRIEDGMYGICKVTNELIPLERLEEVPVAKHSVKGKEILAERKRRGIM